MVEGGQTITCRSDYKAIYSYAYQKDRQTLTLST